MISPSITYFKHHKNVNKCTINGLSNLDYSHITTLEQKNKTAAKTTTKNMIFACLFLSNKTSTFSGAWIMNTGKTRFLNSVCFWKYLPLCDNIFLMTVDELSQKRSSLDEIYKVRKKVKGKWKKENLILITSTWSK